MQKPTIHLNGTSGETLTEGYLDAMDAISNAMRKLGAIAPHARDYYVQGDDAFHKVWTENAARVTMLQHVRTEIGELLAHVQEQLAEREAIRRGR